MKFFSFQQKNLTLVFLLINDIGWRELEAEKTSFEYYR